MASAQSYPDRIIKLIVPYTPGSPVDVTARVLTQHLQPRLGQNFIIENRPGGGTTIGTKAVVSAEPDGYTLLINGTSMVYLPVLFPSVDQAMIKSLVPIAPLVEWWDVIVVAPTVPATTLAELVAYGKANPGKLIFGYGQGTTPHMMGETLKRATGLEFTMVPYRGGEQARADLVGGRVDINIAPTANLLAIIQDGKARALAYTGKTRSPDLPQVPTVAEAGYPSVGYDPDVWLGLFAPAGTPTAIVEKLNTHVAATMKSPEVKATLAKLGFEAKFATPREFAAFYASEVEKWPPILSSIGMKAE
jgi:tripartite-type tricarboxylate transporter receptor subunit TctC